ncbi:hypothetical protein BDN72DRAFT_794822 [Pluteus cervinus]|uniref:Uncharacterized protein n=1 Tax=Pluteus cervinus TaxID=181527 RepID=A0ACD3AYY0_9AGAR|nr:hypothetical protein BDN72DRAFT_794822 [Pluteus cervinus]
MFVPFISTRNPNRSFLGKRKGGGGGGKGGGGGSKGGGSSSSGKGGSSGSSKGSSGSGSSSGSSRPSSVSVGGGTSKTAHPYSFGGGPVVVIPSGSQFAGRQEGGANRNEVFGTKQFGSGYPGLFGRGVGGRGFPFYYWPLAWAGVGAVGTGAASYAYLNSDEFSPDGKTRPGGQQATAYFLGSNPSDSTTYRLISDNGTVSDLITDILGNCVNIIDPSRSSSSPSFYDNTTQSPRPEQVIQYYRASTAALTLDGYNNSAVFQSGLDANDTSHDSLLPSSLNTTVLDCLNSTIGTAIPLVDASTATIPRPSLGVMGFVGIVVALTSMV